ncbi:MAG: DUF1593 domain-containing protein [Phycisphaerae bacterium]|jgi:hypothetical protein|nr:DUF1593 domain-containing protein [Phycisphaerae bacterium]
MNAKQLAWFILPVGVCFCFIAPCRAADAKTAPAPPAKPRVIVSTDIGGSDPDDFQSMVHYLVCADMFDTEGLISSPPKKGRKKHILEAIDAYEKDYANLKTWSSGYPSPDALRKITRQGAVDPQKNRTPDKNISKGARLIIEAAKRKDPRPLYVIVWGSITDIAQAVHNAPDIKKKIRVHSIGSWNTANDRRARDYLYDNHKDMWWIESDTTFRGMYQGGDHRGDLSNREFPERHVKGHGALGALFMDKKPDIKMGDTPSVLYLMHGDPSDPTAEHWGGAFIRPSPKDRPRYWRDNPDPKLIERGKKGAQTVNKWRKAYLRHWQNRMDRTTTAPGKKTL